MFIVRWVNLRSVMFLEAEDGALEMRPEERRRHRQQGRTMSVASSIISGDRPIDSGEHFHVSGGCATTVSINNNESFCGQQHKDKATSTSGGKIR